MQDFLKIKVQGGNISGGANYSIGQGGWSLRYIFDIQGTLDEKGEIVNGKWTTVISGGGPSNNGKCQDKLDGSGAGTMTGNIKEKLVLTGNQTMKGIFVCNPQNDSSKVDPIEIRLIKK